MYEIVVFENHSVYDGDYVSPNNLINIFVGYCKKYINPIIIEKEYTEFLWGHTYVSYKDNSGNDKPIMIMLIGNISLQMRCEIQLALKNFYICEKCSLECCANCKDY